MNTELLGMTAAALTTAAFVPQVIKVWRSRSARDISLPMYTMFVSGIGLWFVYGLLVESLPIISANGVTFVLALAVIVMKLKFDRLEIQTGSVTQSEQERSHLLRDNAD